MTLSSPRDDPIPHLVMTYPSPRDDPIPHLVMTYPSPRDDPIPHLVMTLSLLLQRYAQCWGVVQPVEDLPQVRKKGEEGLLWVGKKGVKLILNVFDNYY